MSNPSDSISKTQTESCSKKLGHLVLSGSLTRTTVPSLWQRVDSATAVGEGQLHIDTSGVSEFDSAGVAMLVAAKHKAAARGLGFDVRGMSAEMQVVYERMNGLPPAPSPRRCCPPFFDSLGRTVVSGLRNSLEILAFIGELTVFSWQALKRPGKFRWADWARILERTGVDAVPVVMLISFLLGLILAFESVIPLKMFGAEIYVANLIGLSVIRELGTLVAAIVLAGRTASAFAAEIGTMTVNEEISALRTMGVEPIRFLTLPRVLAAAVALPLLSLFADLAGLAGGYVVLHSLGYSFHAFYTHAISFVTSADFFVSLFKAFVFGILIGGTGCLRGLQTGQNADSVGCATTSAVVSSIIAISVADGIFAVLFYVLGI